MQQPPAHALRCNRSRVLGGPPELGITRVRPEPFSPPPKFLLLVSQGNKSPPHVLPPPPPVSAGVFMLGDPGRGAPTPGRSSRRPRCPVPSCPASVGPPSPFHPASPLGASPLPAAASRVNIALRGRDAHAPRPATSPPRRHGDTAPAPSQRTHTHSRGRAATEDWPALGLKGPRDRGGRKEGGGGGGMGSRGS